MLTYQDIIALALVAWAVAYLTRRAWRFASLKTPRGCMGCKGCPAAQPLTVVALKNLTDSPVLSSKR